MSGSARFVFDTNVLISADRPSNRDHVCRVEPTDLPAQPQLRSGRDLVGHRLAPLAFEYDVSFARIEMIDSTGQRHGPDPVEQTVRGIIADHN
jgi:hypothetical protein